MSRLAVIAHGYADRGWPVFPCEVRGKRPFGRLVVHGLKDASTDHDVIEQWWEAAPEANVGLPTGIAFDALDIDGDAGMTSLVLEMPSDAPTVDGPTVTTGKGAHCYVAPAGLGNRARFIPGCDWRGIGGYVIGAGSVHPNGATYEWKCGEADPDFGIDAPILPAPRWLLDMLQRKDESPRTAGVTSLKVNASAYGKRALEGEVGKVLLAPVGQRNDGLNCAAFALGSLVAAGVLDVDDVIDALLLAAERVGLERDEAEKTIASGLRSGARQPRRVS